MATYKFGSRFNGGRINEFRGSSTTFQRYIRYDLIEPVGTITIQPGQEFRPDLLSQQVYGQANLGWYIMGMNQIDKVSDLRIGVTLQIGPLSAVT